MTRVADEPRSGRALRAEEKRLLAVLGLPTFVMALSITLVSTYLPKVLQQFTSSTLAIGAIVGGEGAMALWVPLVVGPWSDRLRTRFGRRLPFLLAGVPVMAVSLILMGVVASLWAIALVAALFFLAYFVAYEPYRALYPDLIDAEEVAGRAQSTQALWRGAGTGLALLCGGLLLAAARPAPFVVAGGLALAVTAGFARFLVKRQLVAQGSGEEPTPREVIAQLRRLLVEHPALRAYMVANALWEMSLAALKVFVVLYLTRGLGFSLAVASLIVGGTALVILVGAVIAGKLGDRLGRLSVVRRSLWPYGLGYAVAVFTTFKPLLALAIPVIALGGGSLMSLSYAILMPLMPEEERGALTGFYSVSRGLGIVLGPLVAGGAIALSGGLFGSTHGYAAMWIVCSGAALGSIPFVARVRAHAGDRAELRES